MNLPKCAKIESSVTLRTCTVECKNGLVHGGQEDECLFLSSVTGVQMNGKDMLVEQDERN